MENKISFKTELLLYILLSFIMAIDTLCFYSQDEEDILCLAAISHFIIIVIMCNFISISKKKRIFFWGQLACNYLIIIPKCVWFNSGEMDLYGIILYIIPFFINFLLSINIKQLVILNINSMMVIGFCQREELLHNGGINIVETEGVVTVVTLLSLVLAYILSTILLILKYNKQK